MAVTDFFIGEITTELLKMLISICQKSCRCKTSAEQLAASITELLPIIQEIKYSGVELPQNRQSQLDKLSEWLRSATELAHKILSSRRWNVYKNLQQARKMEKLEKQISSFVQGPMQFHILADVHHIRSNMDERLDRVDASTKRLEERLGAMKIGGGGWVEEAVKMREEQEERWEGSLGCGGFGLGLNLGKTKVKEMLIGREDPAIIGITGIGGSGKTTLAKEVAKDSQVQSYFGNRILFLTVSQSPDVRQLLGKIQGYISGSTTIGTVDARPHWTLPYDWSIKTRTLIVLDDVWSQSDLDQLIWRAPGCKTLVVSRSKFPSLLNSTYQVELLKEDEAMSLFCFSAFGKKSVPAGINQNSIKQLVNECKGLPLALKVLGASLRDQPEKYWEGVWKRLLRGEPANDSHENKVLKRMEASLDCLPEKVKECFLDLGSFPEDKKIPLDALINMWVEIHDIDEEEAFAILVDLSNKNLLTLVKDSRGGDMYSSYFEIVVTQHDVLRDLAIHLSSDRKVIDRKRLLMPRRETTLPKEWERHMGEQFNAQIVSIHTGKMQAMDWPCIEFPKAEVLILNFASSEYFLPPFIDNMPMLKALIVVNYGASNAILSNFTTFANLANLRSLWLEKVSVPQLSTATVPMRSLRKMSLVLCKINNSFDQSVVDLPQIFPRLSELTIDHSDDLVEVPSTICGLRSLKCLSITNCHRLHELPANLGKLKSIDILRLYACPNLKTLPAGICELVRLKYLDISQCVNLTCLPQRIGDLGRLEKMDMRECPQIMDVPVSAVSLQSLRHVICDEEISWQWKDVEKVKASLYVQVAEKCYSLDWLDE